MKALAHAARRATAVLQACSPVLDLALRLYVAQVFLRAGVQKLGNWPGTLYLFEHEYRVPLLSPVAAAWLGTFGEIVFPVLLAAGLAARFSALALSVVNGVAVIAFWHVLAENDAARMHHFYWALLLLVTVCHGPGALSLDRWLARRFA